MKNNQKPILFSTPMVNAILEGRKTMTRRLVKMYEKSDEGPLRQNPTWLMENKTCPYGKVGDVLWVRETWCLKTPYGPEEYYYGYKAYDDCLNILASSKYDYESPDIWRPSIHMPKEACRIFLKITNIRVEKLQDISKEDAIAEGIELEYDEDFGWTYKHYLKDKFGPSPIHSFQTLWQSINGAKSWDDNPWVWVIEFERINKSEINGKDYSKC